MMRFGIISAAVFAALIGVFLSYGGALAAGNVESKTYRADIGCGDAVFTPTLPPESGSFGRTVPSSTDTSVVTPSAGRAGMGGNGAITLTGNRNGSATVTYAVQNDTATYQQNITINVTVTCLGGESGGGRPPPSGPSSTHVVVPNGGNQGANLSGGGSSAAPPGPGGPFPSFTHRQTRCTTCRELAAHLNADIDAYTALQSAYQVQSANPRTRGMAAATAAQLQGLLSEIRQLSDWLTACEQRCAAALRTPAEAGGHAPQTETPGPGGHPGG